jgi:4-oxalocrotonate tautomerase
MPIVEVTLVEGRSRELKARLIAELTDSVERVLGAPRPSIRVVLREVPPENWGVAGVPKAGPPTSG